MNRFEFEQRMEEVASRTRYHKFRKASYGERIAEIEANTEGVKVAIASEGYSQAQFKLGSAKLKTQQERLGVEIERVKTDRKALEYGKEMFQLRADEGIARIEASQSQIRLQDANLSLTEARANLTHRQTMLMLKGGG